MCENKVDKELYVFEYTWIIRNLDEKISCSDEIERELDTWETTRVTSTTFKSHNGNHEWILELTRFHIIAIDNESYQIEIACAKVSNILHEKKIEISIGSAGNKNGYDEAPRYVSNEVNDRKCYVFMFTYDELLRKFGNDKGDLTIVLRISEPLYTATNYIRETNELVDDYEKLFRSGDQSDFKIIVGDKQFIVHKHILSVRSNYFSAMFKHGTKEQANNQVEISDVRYEVMFEVLKYIYCAKVNIEEDIAYDLLTAADMYQMNGLKRKCEKTVIENLKANNVGKCMVYAERYNNDYLKVATSDFLMKNASEFTKGDIDLLKSNLNLISCPFMTSLLSRSLFATELNKKVVNQIV